MPSLRSRVLLAASFFSLAEARLGHRLRQAAEWKSYASWTSHLDGDGASWASHPSGNDASWTGDAGLGWSATSTTLVEQSSAAAVVLATSAASTTPIGDSSAEAVVWTTVDTTVPCTTSTITGNEATTPSWMATQAPSEPDASTFPTSASLTTATMSVWTSAWTNEGWVTHTTVETSTMVEAYHTDAAASATAFPAGYSLEQCIGFADNELPSWAGDSFNYSGVVRNFYVTSEQFAWNYAPSGWDNWLGVPIGQSARAIELGYLSSSGSLGGENGMEWQKAHYVGYTDNTFTTQTEQPDWMGLNGPVVRAELGDMVQIIFVNKLAANYMSMHSMGLGYDETNKGALYLNALGPDSVSTPQPGDAVPPGGCFTYKWLVGPTNSPAVGFDSRIWSYHPYVNMPNDLVTGLVGPVIIYNPGTMDATMSGNREFILLYEGFPEWQSWLDAASVAAYNPNSLADLQTAAALSTPPTPTDTANSSLWAPQLTNMPQLRLTPQQAPVFQTLNGYIFGNAPPYEMCQSDRAVWYIYAFGAQSHTFHLHGNNFQVAGDPLGFFRASQSLNNGEMITLSMNGSRPGVWQAICHVSNHLPFGMVDYYRIYESGACPLTPLTSVGNGTIQ